MAYGNNKMNTQAPMPMRPGIGTLPKAGGMNPMATGGMGPMTNRGVNPMQGGLMQGLAAQGRRGDTELAHVNPVEANLLKSLGGSGTINPNTGLREYGFWDDASSWWNENVRDPVSQLYGNIDTALGGWLPGGVPAPTWRDVVQSWGQHLGMPVSQSEEHGLYWGKYPGSDEDWEAALGTTGTGGYDPKSGAGRIESYLKTTKSRADELKSSLGTDIGGLLSRATGEFGEENKAYANQIGSMNAANVGAGIGPTDPTKGHVANVRQGADTLNRKYTDDRYALLADAQKTYFSWLNNIVSPEARAAAPTFETMTQDMPWLQDPNAPSNTLVT